MLDSGVPAKDDPQSGVLKPFPPAHVDRVVQDGEMVRLGNIALTATATPGHTPARSPGTGAAAKAAYAGRSSMPTA